MKKVSNKDSDEENSEDDLKKDNIADDENNVEAKEKEKK